MFPIVALALLLGACASVPTAPNSTLSNPQVRSSAPARQEAAPTKQEVVIACVRPVFDGKTVSVIAKDDETETGKRRRSGYVSRTKAEEIAEEILVVRGAVTQQLRAWGATVTERRADAQIILEIMIRRSGRHYYVHFFLMDKARRVELAQGVGSAIFAHKTLRDHALRFAAQVAISELCVYQEQRAKEGAAPEGERRTETRVAPVRPSYRHPPYAGGYSSGAGITFDATAGVRVGSPARSRGTVRGFEHGPDGSVTWTIKKIRR